LGKFFLSEDPGLDIKPYAKRDFERKAAAPAWRYIKDQLCVFPVFKLISIHIKPAISYFAQAYITATQPELTFRKAHWLASIATSTALMKHQRAIIFF
jgi:hypothetical protein